MITAIFFIWRNVKRFFKTIKSHSNIFQFSGIEYRILKFKAIFDPRINLNDWLYSSENIKH